MLILLYGEDTYRLKQKLDEIIHQYKSKNFNGLDLCIFDDNPDFDKFKEKIEAVSMFSEKKLIVFKNFFDNKNFEDDFFEYAKIKKLKNNQDNIIVLCNFGKLAVSGFKRKMSMAQEFKLLTGKDLINWIKKQVKKNNANISIGAVQRLAAFVGNDLWQIENELNKLISYKANQEIIEKDIDLLVSAKFNNNIFNTLDALANKDKKTALKLLHKHLNQGENEMYLFTMFIYQIRNLLKLKDLIDSGVAYYSLSQKSGLHPYVVKKSSAVLRNFSLGKLKDIYYKLLDIDLKLKSGRIDGLTALDLLVMEM